MEFGAEDIFQYASDMGNWLMDTAVVPPSVSIHDGLMGRRGLGKGKQPNSSLLGNLEEPGPEVLWPEEETPTFRSIIFFCGTRVLPVVMYALTNQHVFNLKNVTFTVYIHVLYPTGGILSRFIF